MAQNLDKGNLYQAAKRANLNPAQMQQIDSLSEMYSTHSRLSGLPVNVAAQEYSQLSPDKQKSLASFVGEGKKDPVKEGRSFIENAAYILSRPIVEPIKAVFNTAMWLSDQTTRLYRTGTIAAVENKNLADAWKQSGAKGENVFNPDRIEQATKQYGYDTVAVAKKIAAGIPLDQIIAEAPNENQKRIAAEGSQDQGSLLTEAVAKVNAAKYSPGRQLANAILPEDLEGKGALYTWLSGSTDAAFRMGLDPTLLLGKAAKMYRGAQYALSKTAGSVENVNRAFDTSTVRGRNITRFWEEYTDLTSQLVKARESGETMKIGEITGQLRRLNPAFVDNNVGESLIDYAKNNYNGVISLTTAKNFLSDVQNIDNLMYGQPGYWVKYMPRLSAIRKKKLELYTGTSRVFDLNKDSADFVRNIAFDEATLQGITPAEQALQTLVGKAGETAVEAGLKTGERIKDATAQSIFKSRWSLGAINRRLDKLSAKFARIPIQKDLQNLASDKSIRAIGQLARPIYGRFGSRVIEDMYRVSNLGQRRLIAQGLATTVLKVRGAEATPGGKKLIESMGNLGRDAHYSNPIVDPVTGIMKYPSANASGVDSALYPYQLSDGMLMPSLDEVDKAVAREGWLGKAWGLQYREEADKIIDGWTTLTILSPRFPVRNAIEDFAVGFANGVSLRSFIRGRREATKIRTISQELELGMVNKLIKGKKSEEIAAEFKLVNEGKWLMPNGLEAKTYTEKEMAKRQIFAKGLLDNKFDDAAKGVFKDKYDQFVYEFAMYGNPENLLNEVAEGAYNFAVGANSVSIVGREGRKRGRVVDFTIDGKAYRKMHKSNYRPEAIDNETAVGWAFQISAKASDQLGSEGILALHQFGKANNARNLFVRKMERIISEPRFDQMRKDMQRYYEDVNYTPRLHAQQIYDDLMGLFGKRDRSLNYDLLNKVVTPNAKTKRFEVNPQGISSLSDLPTSIDDLPVALTIPRFVPASQSENFISDIVTWGWDKAAAANARFSRDGLVVDAAFHVRRDLEPFKNQLVESFKKSGMPADYAEAAATRRVVELSENLAVERVLSFVDNPEVRSYLAWNSRNFARFYRATEDAYRRLRRTLRYNPQGIQKLALTYEGVTHAGFVQRDDQGEPYFIYPGVAPVYSAVNRVLTAVGLGDKFVAPMPLQFGASIKMLTPSADPNSWIPTFSGPLAGVSLKTIYGIAGAVQDFDIPVASRIGKEIASTEKYALGKYSEETDIVNAFLPAHINKALRLFDTDERDSQYASAFRKAVTYLEAGGYAPKPDATPGEIQQYQDRLKTTIHSILGVRFALGFVVPANPGVQLKSDMADWVRDNGRTNFKQVYLELINKYADGPDPVGRAMEDWVKFFPNQVPFTVSESDPRIMARFKTSQEAANWVENNNDLIKQYPEGAGFLIPQTGEFTFDAYKALKAEGFRQNKLVGDFLQEVSASRSRQYYYEQRDVYERMLSETSSEKKKRELKDKWDIWSKEFKAFRPVLQLELAESAEKVVKRKQSYENLKKMLDETNINTAEANSLRKMISVYEEYLYNTSVRYNSRSQDDIDARKNLKEAARIELREIATENANASSAYDILFANFLRD
jgi:hypothetical protein